MKLFADKNEEIEEEKNQRLTMKKNIPCFSYLVTLLIFCLLTNSVQSQKK